MSIKAIHEETHYINSDFNQILNLISLSEERSLYILIKELKKRYNQCLHWGYEDEDVEYIQDSEGNMLIKKFHIPAYDIKRAYEKSKINFEHTKDLFCNLPFVINKHMPDGSIRRQGLFNELYYNKNYERFEIDVNDRFYDFIKLENKEMERYFKVYHNEFFRLNGKYSRKMYRLISLFNNQKFFSQSLETLRDYFLQYEYDNKEFVRNVIVKSISEIEQKTSFKISYKKIKKGRFLNKINFSIHRIENKKI